MPREFDPTFTAANAQQAAASSHLNALRGAAPSANLMGTSDPRLRANSPLPRDAEIAIDDAINVARPSPGTFVPMLIRRGLVRPLPNWLSVLELENRAINDVGEANQTMELDVRYERSVPDLGDYRIPIYATWEATDFPQRLLSVADRAQWPFETNFVTSATNHVNRKVENQSIHGLGFNMRGHTAPGILTDPVNTIENVDSKSWLDPTKTSVNIEDDIDAAANELADESAGEFTGPFALVLGTALANRLNKPYVTNYKGTLREQILSKDYGGTLEIVSTPEMPVDYWALVQLSSDVIDVVVGQGPQKVVWRLSNHPYSGVGIMIVACEIVRTHTTYTGKSGIIVGYKDPL